MTKQLRYHEDHDYLCDKYTIVKTYYNSLILLNYLSSGSPATSTVKSRVVETICIPLVWNIQKHPLHHAVPSNCPCIFRGQEDTSRQPNVRSVMSCITTIYCTTKFRGVNSNDYSNNFHSLRRNWSRNRVFGEGVKEYTCRVCKHPMSCRSINTAKELLTLFEGESIKQLKIIVSAWLA